MTASVMPWLAAVLLAALGWYALVPVWTQGLGGVVIGPDGQPSLWMAAVRVGWLAVLTAMGCCLAYWPKAAESWRPGFARSRAVGTWALVTVVILYLAMAGQPLRLWYLLAHGVWDVPFVAGGTALLVSGVFFRVVGKVPRVVGALLTLVTAGGWRMSSTGIIQSFYPGNAFPACIDWAVLAFALSCGAFAAWMNTDDTSRVVQAQDRQKDF
ncbi:MAG: hypothetical protein FD177_2322 [Desulfovibrionaceae bacterium]|nr:MAG: hypothetical protein FD177_2322 [Desulfovibrionaceae bacterium]